MSADFIDKLALIYVADGRLLSTRSKGKDVYYIPGGKRESGESDRDALIREIREELNVILDAASLEYINTFEGEAHGHPPGTLVRLTCYEGQLIGQPSASSEIEELVWLTYADRASCAPVDQIIFDWLKAKGQLT